MFILCALPCTEALRVNPADTLRVSKAPLKEARQFLYAGEPLRVTPVACGGKPSRSTGLTVHRTGSPHFVRLMREIKIIPLISSALFILAW